MNEQDVVARIRDDVRRLQPYRVKEVDGGIIQMDKNENPYDLPEAVRRGILDVVARTSWSRYPPIVATKLYEKIARYAGWKPDGVIAGNGSDEIILITLMTFLTPGKRLVVPSPSFPMFAYMATLIGATVDLVPLNDDYSYNVDTLAGRFLDDGDMLIICTPNNPTGGLFPLDRLEDILRRTTKPVVVDEAYYEFSKQTALPLLETHPNLILLRTFSKAFSLAGQRIGYALMSPAVAEEMGKVKLPFNLDLFSITAASRLLDDPAVVNETVNEILAERDRVYAAMESIDNLTVYPTAANFILFRTPYSPQTVLNGLLADGILVRDLSANPALAGTLRVTVSKPDHNDRFLASLERTLNELGTRE